MSTKWRSYGIFFQRSRLIVRSFFSQTKFPLLAFNLPYEGFSDCLLVPQNELRPRDCEKRSKTQAGKRVPSINIYGKFKSEYNVVFTGFLFKLLKTVMFSPNKKVANWHVHWTNIYFHRRVMYRGILQSIGITAQAHYHDYHRQLRQGFENYLTSICQTDELMDFALSRVLKIIPASVFVHQKFRGESGVIVAGAVKE